MSLPKTARFSDISAIHPPARRVTGSFDLPLNAAGRHQAGQLAARLKGKVDRVFTSPMQRAVETAKMIAPDAKVDPGLGPMKLGAHEGKPSEAERPKIHGLFHTPQKHPGKSPLTGQPGETANQFRMRVLSAVTHRLRSKKPGETEVAVTHGRNIKLVDSWLHAGAKPNLSIDPRRMTSHTAQIGTGDLYHVNLPARKLDAVKEPVKGGYHLARHGATNFNPPGADAGSTGGKGSDTGS